MARTAMNANPRPAENKTVRVFIPEEGREDERDQMMSIEGTGTDALWTRIAKIAAEGLRTRGYLRTAIAISPEVASGDPVRCADRTLAQP